MNAASDRIRAVRSAAGHGFRGSRKLERIQKLNKKNKPMCTPTGLRSRYAMPGTDIAYGALLNFKREPFFGPASPRVSAAKSIMITVDFAAELTDLFVTPPCMVEPDSSMSSLSAIDAISAGTTQSQNKRSCIPFTKRTAKASARIGFRYRAQKQVSDPSRDYW
eukprot:694944-Rhodomonas_salina.8